MLLIMNIKNLINYFFIFFPKLPPTIDITSASPILLFVSIKIFLHGLTNEQFLPKVHLQWSFWSHLVLQHQLLFRSWIFNFYKFCQEIFFALQTNFIKNFFRNHNKLFFFHRRVEFLYDVFLFIFFLLFLINFCDYNRLLSWFLINFCWSCFGRWNGRSLINKLKLELLRSILGTPCSISQCQ